MVANLKFVLINSVSRSWPVTKACENILTVMWVGVSPSLLSSILARERETWLDTTSLSVMTVETLPRRRNGMSWTTLDCRPQRYHQLTSNSKQRTSVKNILSLTQNNEFLANCQRNVKCWAVQNYNCIIVDMTITVRSRPRVHEMNTGPVTQNTFLVGFSKRYIYLCILYLRARDRQFGSIWFSNLVQTFLWVTVETS